MPHLIAAFDLVATLMVIVGLGGLIFFHELGHFLACRVTGTRVETFSIGFGPKIWGWRRGHTLYKIGAIPLGGYVKMAAENPGEVSTGAPDEFTSKSYGQRLLIMSAGVIFNIILAVILYVWAFWIGVPFMSPQIGSIERGSPAWEAGLQRGDLVTHVDDNGIQSFTDLRQEVAFSSEGQVLSLTVVRDGELLTLPVRPRYSETEGMPIVGLKPMRETGAVQEGSPIAKAGGRVQDTVLQLDGMPVAGPREFDERLLISLEGVPEGAATATLQVLVRRQDGSEETLKLVLPLEWRPRIGVRPFYERPRIVGVRPGVLPVGLIQADDLLLSVNGAAVQELGLLRRRALDDDEPVREFVVRRDGEERTVRPEGELGLRAFADALAGKTEHEGLRVTPAPAGPAASVGLEAGARIQRVDGKKIEDFGDLVDAVQAAGSEPLRMEIKNWGQNEPTVVTVTPKLAAVPAENPGYAFAYLQRIHQETSVLGGVAMGWRRTILSAQSVALTIRSLLTARVSARHIGGPLTLFDMSYTMWQLGFGRFLYILALISVNLAILNMLPVPVLDGGQIVLLTAEKIRGKPLPDRLVGGLQLMGLVLLLGLMFLAIRNDISRLF